MQKTLTLSILLISLLVNTSQAQDLNSRHGDETALSDLYKQTNGDNWFNNTGWNGGNVSLSTPMSGIVVEMIGGELRVVEIDMQKQTFDAYNVTSGNNLVGTLPESIGNLTKVKKLNVKQNRLTGIIPESIGNMVSLIRLSLGGQGCELTLDNPTWFEANHTRCLGVSESTSSGKRFEHTNEFTGQIPRSIGNLVNLELLEIRAQRLTGVLPAEIGLLTNLRGLFLNDQKGSNNSSLPTDQRVLGGPIPPEWGNLVKLEYLVLSNRYGDASFTDEVPVSLQNLSNIRNIQLDRNSFIGHAPIFPKATDIYYVELSGNNFTGPFPIDYFSGKNGRMEKFTLNGNNLSGEIPSEIPPVTLPAPRSRDNYYLLGHFSIRNNNFTGTIPKWLGDPGRLIIFYINGNNFTGIDDDFFEKFYRTRNINFSGNNFGTTLPSSFGNSRSTSSSQRLEFNGAGFTGKIPESWGNYQSDGVMWLYLNNNDLHGPIPVGMAKWSWLAGRDGLRINKNHFTYSDIIPLLNEWPSEIPIQYQDQKQFPVDDYLSPVKIQSEGSTATFNLSDVNIDGNVYQWRRNGENLSNGGRISGANSHTLVISTIDASDAGEYTLRITNTNAPQLTESISQPITLRIGDSSDTLEAPGLLQSKTNPDDVQSTQLLWTPVDGADMYRVQTATVNSFPVNGTVTYNEIEDNSLVIEDLAYETSYFFRVMAYNDSQESPWSETGDFTTGPAGLVAELDVPELLAADYYPEDDPDAIHLNWKPVEEATHYPVEISTDQSFPAGGTSAFEENGETSLFIESLSFETTYYYRVRARSDSKQSPWSKTEQFTTTSQPVYTFSTPEILEPELNMDGNANSVQLNWTPVDGALTYNLQLATKDQFQPRFTIDIDGVETGSILLENLDFDTTYYYRIKALDESRQSSWSDIAQFTTSADPSVQLSSPNGSKKKENPGKGNKDNTIELEWEEVVVADDYQLQLSIYVDFPAEETMNVDSVEGNSYTVDDLMYETTYYYRIRARKGRAFSPWSQISSTVTGQDHNRSGMDPTTGVPLDYDLDQNYPNPFNPTTQIRYSIPEATFVTIDILNIQGQRVHQLVSRMQEAGVYTVPFDASSLASGIYLYRISAGTFRHLKKMTVIK